MSLYQLIQFLISIICSSCYISISVLLLSFPSTFYVYLNHFAFLLISVSLLLLLSINLLCVFVSFCFSSYINLLFAVFHQPSMCICIICFSCDINQSLLLLSINLLCVFVSFCFSSYISQPPFAAFHQPSMCICIILLFFLYQSASFCCFPSTFYVYLYHFAFLLISVSLFLLFSINSPCVHYLLNIGGFYKLSAVICL